MENQNIQLYALYMHRSPDGKVYIGQTKYNKAPEKRWGYSGEGYKGNIHFWNAIQKYGWDNFEHIVISDEIESSDIDIAEQFFIALFNSMDREFGYNNESGGSLNKTASKQAREKQRNAHLGKYPSEETRKKMGDSRRGERNGNYNREYSDEERKRIRERQLGEKNINYGTHWYNNGKESIRAKECPDGFIPGRIENKQWYSNEYESILATKCPEGYIPGRINFNFNPNSTDVFIGTHWYNNGTKNLRAKECPKGYVPGMIGRKDKK